MYDSKEITKRALVRISEEKENEARKRKKIRAIALFCICFLITCAISLTVIFVWNPFSNPSSDYIVTEDELPLAEFPNP